MAKPVAKTQPVAQQKLSKDAFVLRAIVGLRKPYEEKDKNGVKTGKIIHPKGIHVVYSGFNDAFKRYFGEDADPKAHTTDMAARGLIHITTIKGGANLYLPQDAPERQDKGEAALKTLGLA